MILGLRTVIYHVPDLDKAKAWYASVVGHSAYFDEPFYVGFQVGGFELGLVPDGKPGAGGTTAYWGTANIVDEVHRVMALGATGGVVQDVGGGIRVADLTDPFGNMFGLIENPHFKAGEVR